MQRDFQFNLGGWCVCIGIWSATKPAKEMSAVYVGASQAPAILQSHQTRNTLGKNTKDLWIMGMVLNKKLQSVCLVCLTLKK